MPKINRYSISNFLYGIDRDRMLSDRIIECEGDNVLMDAGNTVGKTNSIRTIIQNICPLADVGRKTITCYKKNKEPIYVLIEWLLDDNKTRLLSGIGFKRKTNFSEEEEKLSKNKAFDFFNFIVQYEGHHPFDMDNINVYKSDKKTNRKYVKPLEELYEEIKNYQKNDKAHIFLYPKSSVKEYQRKLGEYGISVREWQDVIIKLNHSETNLGKYFDDCKTITALIRDKVIPEIELNLSKDESENRLIQLQKQVNKFLLNIKENEQQLLYHDSLIEFQKIIFNTQDIVRKIINEKGNVELLEGELSQLNILGKDFLDELAQAISNEKKDIESKEFEIRDIRYHKASYDIALKEKKSNKVNLQHEELKDNLNIARTQKYEINNKIDILEVLTLYNEKIGIEKNISREEVMIEKMSLEENEILSKISNLGYSIKTNLDKICTKMNEDISTLTKNIGEYTEHLLKNKTDLNNEEQKKNKLQKELTNLNIKIGSYDEYNNNYKKKYNDIEKYISNSLMGESIDFENYETKIINDIENDKNILNENNELLTEYKAKIDALSKEKSNVEKQINYNEFETQNLIKEIEKYNEIKTAIGKYSTSLDIPTNILWNKIEGINNINLKLSRLEKSREGSLKTIESLNEKIKRLTGEINPTISELLVTALDNANIPFVNGYEYLLELELSVKEKKKLLKRNPLIPYSIILTQQDFDKLKILNLDIYTDTSTSIIIRNEIDTQLEFDNFNQIFMFGNNKLLMSFDSDMLDRKKRELEIISLKEQIDRVSVTVKQYVEEIELLGQAKHYIGNIAFEEKDIENLSQKKISKEENAIDLNNRLSDIDSNIKRLNNENVKVNEIIKNTSFSLSSQENKLKEFKVLTDKYAEYETAKSSHNIKEEKLEKILKSQKELKEDIENLNKNIHDINIQTERLKNDLSYKQKERSEYLSYESGDFDSRAIEIILGDFKEYKSKSRTADIQDIKERLSSFKENLKDKQQQLKHKMEISNLHEIPIQKFNESKEELQYELNKLNITIENLDKDERKLNDEKIKLETEIEILIQNITNEFNKEKLSEEMIIIKEFDKEIKELRKGIENIKSKISNLDKKHRTIETSVNKVLKYNKEIKDDNLVKCDIDKYEEKIDSLLSDLDSNNKDIAKLEKTLMSVIYDIDTFDTKICPDIDNMKQLISSNKENVYHLDSILEKNINMYINTKIEITQKYKDIMIKEKETIIREVTTYVKDVVDELKIIDKLGKIDNEVIFRLGIPKDENIKFEKIGEFVENATLANVENSNYSFTTYELLNYVVNIEGFKTKVMKYEINSKYLVNWNEFKDESSGAQTFAIAFIVLNVLLEYKRYNQMSTRKYNSSKVLIMDNPFGDTTSAAVLIPVFAIAEKTNTQIISYSHIKNYTMIDMFNRVYSMEVEQTSSNKEFVQIEKIKAPTEEVRYASYTLDTDVVKQENLFDIIE